MLLGRRRYGRTLTYGKGSKLGKVVRDMKEQKKCAKAKKTAKVKSDCEVRTYQCDSHGCFMVGNYCLADIVHR